MCLGQVILQTMYIQTARTQIEVTLTTLNHFLPYLSARMPNGNARKRPSNSQIDTSKIGLVIAGRIVDSRTAKNRLQNFLFHSPLQKLSADTAVPHTVTQFHYRTTSEQLILSTFQIFIPKLGKRISVLKFCRGECSSSIPIV